VVAHRGPIENLSGRDAGTCGTNNGRSFPTPIPHNAARADPGDRIVDYRRRPRRELIQ